MTSLAINLEDVRDAAARLRGIANFTPVHTSRTLNELTGREIWLKCENFQRSGSFKFRGAYNAISRLPAERRARGVVAFSSGNHAQGAALAAKLFGIPAVICMPDDAPPVKVAATRGYGAEVAIFDRSTVDRDTFARAIAEERGMTVIPPYDHPHIIAGQGTVALELLAQAEGLDALVIPVGGGGLIGGCAVAARGLQPGIRIFGVETEGADDGRQSLERGERVTIPPPATIADGIRTTSPGELTFPIMQRHVERILVVSDEAVLEALRFILLRLKLVAEPTGAVGLAAVLGGLLPPECRRVGVVICGGNLEPSLLARL
ncbi:MAG: pyridoxal-phosphate dependent enzyme [Oscillochloridaceae bacterium]|nr:pyridoxal-phosphate dependent enzyme [Chloroflexaceae bacterium]MDW8389134.1 pyridoxal-phosphate dependent enzyme [Oscillochloridaceae bacterium]